MHQEQQRAAALERHALFRVLWESQRVLQKREIIVFWVRVHRQGKPAAEEASFDSAVLAADALAPDLGQILRL